MDKKGEILFTIFAGIIIVLSIAGALVTISKGENIYIGNKESHLFYEYNKCPLEIEQIPVDNRIIFESENLAVKNNFKSVEGCV